jgi:hypothetical protein
VIELKLRYGDLEATIADGLAQTWAYADASGAGEAHLVIFDRTPGKPWAENRTQAALRRPGGDHRCRS